MHSKQPATEQQIRELSDQLDQLNRRVALLEKLAGAPAPASHYQTTNSPAEQALPTDSEASLLIDSSSLLKLVSVLCFLLVAALGLRALTDNGVLNPQIGSIFGIMYAAGMIIWSHFFYRKANSLAPVFCITGALLIFSITIETHARFSTLPEEIAYAMLALTGIGLATISYANKVALPIIIGTLGMCFSAVAIGYPTPHFPYLILLLWASNILGFFATRLKRCSWLRWLLLFTTHLVLQVWGLKLSGVMVHGQENSAILSPGLFIPFVTLIGLTFILIALLGIIRAGDEKVSKFDFSLPAVNAGWCYIAGIYALKNPTVFGPPAAAAAIIHFALAYWLSRRQKSNAQGTNTFIAGGVILACLSLPALFKSMFLPLPILSLLAFAIGYYSRIWSSGGMRMTSYLLQVYICMIIVLEFIGGIKTQHQSPSAALITIFCCLSALIHFRFARQHKPPPHSQIFSRYDKMDQSALLTLSAGLLNSYFSCIIVAYVSLQAFYQGSLGLAFSATQSILINLGAILLTALAVFRHNNELRNVSIIILLIGGGKVFIYDMFKISGTWLVASIFSFGIAAALESLILARWKSAASMPEAGGHLLPDNPSTENRPQQVS